MIWISYSTTERAFLEQLYDIISTISSIKRWNFYHSNFNRKFIYLTLNSGTHGCCFWWWFYRVKFLIAYLLVKRTGIMCSLVMIVDLINAYWDEFYFGFNGKFDFWDLLKVCKNVNSGGFIWLRSLGCSKSFYINFPVYGGYFF